MNLAIIAKISASYLIGAYFKKILDNSHVIWIQLLPTWKEYDFFFCG